MPHLTKSDREKLANLAKQGNEDALFFLGDTREDQLRKYYRGWIILAVSGDTDVFDRLKEERKRLKSRHERITAQIAAGCCEVDSKALAKRDRRREGARKRQQASRARKNAAKQSGTRKKRKVAQPEVDEATETNETTEANGAEGSRAPNCDMMCSECPVDDDEPLPTGAKPTAIKQEADDDTIELPVAKVAPWKKRLGPAIQTFMLEDEIELKLKKINAEIRQAALEAKKANLELERLYLMKPKLV